jgi:hypothetical protein
MAATQDKTPGRIGDAARRIAASGNHPAKIDPAAPAGSKNSLGEESVRDGRPKTDDSVVEAIDEEAPATPNLPDL